MTENPLIGAAVPEYTLHPESASPMTDVIHGARVDASKPPFERSVSWLSASAGPTATDSADAAATMIARRISIASPLQVVAGLHPTCRSTPHARGLQGKRPPGCACIHPTAVLHSHPPIERRSEQSDTCRWQLQSAHAGRDQS